jgi:hypothetical protein
MINIVKKNRMNDAWGGAVKRDIPTWPTDTPCLIELLNRRPRLELFVGDSRVGN